MIFNTRYTPPESPALVFEKASMTDRSFKDECDINHIVQRCMQTGVMPQVEGGIYGDFADMPDNLQDSYALIQEAGDRFIQLPSEVRREFNNDPMQLLSFLQNPANKERAGQLGLIDLPAQPAAPAPANVSSKETVVTNPLADKGES